MSESLLSMLKKKKVPVKKKKIGVRIPKKGEVAVATTIVDKTEDAPDMSSFRERLKLNKNKTYKTLIKESQTKTIDRDLMSRPQTIPEIERVDLPQDLSIIKEENEEASAVDSKEVLSRQDDVDSQVDEMSRPAESETFKPKKSKTTTKVSKIKSK